MNIPDNILQHSNELAKLLINADELSSEAQRAAKDLANMLVGDDPYMILVADVFSRVAERAHITYNRNDPPTLTYDSGSIEEYMSHHEALKRILRGEISDSQYQSTDIRYEKNTLYVTPNTHVKALLECKGTHEETGQQVKVRSVTYGSVDEVVDDAGQKIEAAQDPARLVYDMFYLYSDWIDEYIVHAGDTILERCDTLKEARSTLK